MVFSFSPCLLLICGNGDGQLTKQPRELMYDSVGSGSCLHVKSYAPLVQPFRVSAYARLVLCFQTSSYVRLVLYVSEHVLTHVVSCIVAEEVPAHV